MLLAGEEKGTHVLRVFLSEHNSLAFVCMMWLAIWTLHHTKTWIPPSQKEQLPQWEHSSHINLKCECRGKARFREFYLEASYVEF